MRERYQMKSGNDSVIFDDKTLCQFLAISLVLSITSMSVEDVFKSNFFGLNDLMPAWRYSKML